MDKSIYKLILAATGSVAALKIPLLVKLLLELNRNNKLYSFEIRVIVTEHAKHFFEVSELPSEVILYDDNSEWQAWQRRGDPVLHIELGKWADLMVIAPLDANTLAKMAQDKHYYGLGMTPNEAAFIVRSENPIRKTIGPNITLGICDNLLTCTTRAWDLTKPLLFCPAMNTRMWEHPITATQINTLKEWGHGEIPPINKLLMCGDKGVGAMAEVTAIVEQIKQTADEVVQKLQNQKI